MTTNPREQFEVWLADMDDALERFLGGMSAAIRPRLNYSPESLDVLEGWMLERYASADDLLKTEAKAVLDGLARYVGEAYRKALGARWEIRLDDPEHVCFGLPQLAGFAQRTTPIAPHPLVTASADRRTGRYWRTVLEKTQKRVFRVHQ